MTTSIGSSNLAFRSSWLGNEGGQAVEVIRGAKELGLFNVELGPHLNADPPEKLSRLFKEEMIRVAAVQSALSTGGGSSEFLEADTLADPRPAAAQKSIALTLETAKAARLLGAGKVILHPGTLRDEKLKKIHENFSDLFRKEGMTEEATVLIKKGRAIAEGSREAWLDRIIRILFDLLRAEPEITFCLENRYAFHELPDLPGLSYIFEDLKSPRLKYWHNTGWAHVQEITGLVDAGAWLDTFGGRTAGVHLHDAAGLDTHLPPGCGDVDFRGVIDALPRDAIRVIDLGIAATTEEIKLGIHELKRLGL